MSGYNGSVLLAMPLLALLALLRSGKLKRGLRDFAKAVIRARKREQEISVNSLKFAEPLSSDLVPLEKAVFRPGEYLPRFFTGHGRSARLLDPSESFGCPAVVVEIVSLPTDEETRAKLSREGS